jgi:phage tail-like protein
MARHTLLDELAVFRFHLLDVCPLIPPHVPVFMPQAGFSSATAPEITAEIEEIPEGNFIAKRKVIKGATVSAITLSRGSTFYDSDFWRWFSRGILGPTPKMGNPRVRRNFLLIQFAQDSGVAAIASTTAFGAGLVAAAGETGGSLAASMGASAGIVTGMGGIWRMPAKTWMLWNCLPSRWKAASDFDARSSEVSIAELDLEPELVEEYSLAAFAENLIPG